jgi:hypothetical protein
MYAAERYRVLNRRISGSRPMLGACGDPAGLQTQL